MHKEILHGLSLVLLCVICSCSAVLALLFTPSFVDLRDFFDLSDGSVLNTISTYLAGFALGMLYHLLLANRFGRRAALQSGLACAMVAGFLILCVDVEGRFWLFSLFRLLQGFGASCGFILVLNMIADTHEKDRFKALFIVVYSFLVAIVMATFLGGVIATHWGWYGCFFFTTLYTAVLFLFAFGLPETLSFRRERGFGATVRGYIAQFKDSFFVLHGCMGGLALAILYLFPSLTPFIALEEIELLPDVYGLFSFIAYLGLAFGFYSWIHYNNKQRPRVAMLVGISYVILGSFVMQVLFTHYEITPWSLFLPSAVILAGPGLLYLSAFSVVFNETKERRIAFAAFQFIVLVIAAVVIGGVSLLPQNASLYPRASAGVAVLALMIWFFLRAHHVRLKRRGQVKKRTQRKGSMLKEQKG